MRICLPFLLIAQVVVVSSDHAAADDGGSDFYFNFSESPFSPDSSPQVKTYTMAVPPDGGSGGSTADSSIVDSRDNVPDTMMFDFHWPTGATFKNAILVDATSGNEVAIAWGYNSDDAVPEVLEFPVSQKGSLTINSTMFSQLFPEYNNRTLFFQLGWNDSSGVDYYGTSPAWAVGSDPDAASSLFSQMLAMQTTMLATSTIPAVYSVATTPQVNPSSSASSAGLTTSSAAAAATSTSSSSGAAASVQPTKGSAAATVLSTGAIIGIVVGGVAALVLLSALAGCLCIRRRRRNRGSNSSAVPTPNSRDVHDIIAEKERHVDTQPGTPYSEITASEVITPYHHQHQQHAIGTAITTGGEEDDDDDDDDNGRHTQQHRSTSSSVYESSSMMMASPERRDSGLEERAYSPYRDQPRAMVAADSNTDPAEAPPPPGGMMRGGDDNGSARTGTPTMGPAARFGRASTPGGGASISEQYAHLVEDGMTDDEIRRLEEEERALDEAIEQARTDSRAAGRL